MCELLYNSWNLITLKSSFKMHSKLPKTLNVLWRVRNCKNTFLLFDFEQYILMKQQEFCNNTSKSVYAFVFLLKNDIG